MFAEGSHVSREDNHAIGVIDPWLLIRRRFGFIVAGVALGLALAYLYVDLTPTVYQSQAEILVIQKEAYLAANTVETNFGDEVLATHQEIIASDRIVRDAMIRGDLQRLDHLRREAEKLARKEVSLSMEDAVVDYIIDNLKVKFGGDGGAKAQVLAIEFWHTSSDECQEILAAVVESYQQFIDETVHGADDEAVELISLASDDLDRKLKTLDDSYREFREQAPILWTQDGTAINPHQVRLAELEAELSRVRFRRTEVKSRLAIVESYLSSPDPEIMNNELPNLSMIDSADVDRLNMLIGAIGHQRHTNRNLRAYSALLKHDLTDFERRESALVESSGQEQEKARKLVSVELQEESLRRARDRAQELYDSVIDGLNDINLHKDNDGFICEIIGPIRAGEKAWPSLPLVLALGAMLGCFIGIGAGLLAEVRDDSFHRPDEIASQLGLPVLANLPRLSRTRSRQLKVKQYGNRLAAFHRPDSLDADSVRTLRAVILAHLGQHSIMQVTSPNRGDGTSTVVANAAISIAQSGKRVLLVDANLRDPEIHNLFALENEIGLSSAVLEEASEEAIVNSQLPGLDILPSGPSRENPSDLLMADSFAKVLDLVRDDYDYVLLDSPPVLHRSDALSIASQVDCTVLNVSPSETKSNARRSVERLSSAGASVLGIVFNQSTWTQTPGNLDAFARRTQLNSDQDLSDRGEFSPNGSIRKPKLVGVS